MSAPTTVVHVFGAMDRGGAEMRTLELIRLVDRQRVHSVFVTLSGRPGSLASEFEAAGAEVVPIRLSPSFPFAFVRFLRRRRVGVVHSHVALFSGVILALAALARVPRRIANFHSDRPRRPGRSRLRKRVQYRITGQLLDWTATEIIGVSPGALSHGWESDWEDDPRCRVVLFGCDLTRFDAVSDVTRLRRVIGAAADDKVIVHVGRGVPLKNRERAIDVFAAVAEKRPSTWLVFVGAETEDDRARWEEQARALGVAERVVFLGERSDVPDLLTGADLLLQTSLYEGLPGVVMEAAAAGTPSLVSRLPGSEYLASRLTDVHPISLDLPDDEWARQALELLGAELTPQSRSAARESLRDTEFDVRRAAPAFTELWLGRSLSTTGSEPSHG